MFQKLLKEVPNWSNAMSKQHADNIADRCAWFNDLLAAVFVACTKILSAVRLKADNKKISLKLPTNEIFIQTCYNNIAKDLYRDPYVFHEDQSIYHRDVKLTTPVEATVDTTNQKQVAKATQDAFAGAFDLGIGGEEAEAPAPVEVPVAEPVVEEEPVPEPMAEPVVEEEPVPEPMAEPVVEEEPVSEPIAQPMGGEESFAEPQPQQEPDDNVFFGDAPEQRTKNPRYN